LLFVFYIFIYLLAINGHNRRYTVTMLLSIIAAFFTVRMRRKFVGTPNTIVKSDAIQMSKTRDKEEALVKKCRNWSCNVECYVGVK